MILRSKNPSTLWGVRLVSGLALALGIELASSGVARATEAEQVTLEEDSGTSSSAKDAKADKEESDEDEPKVRHVVAPYSLPWQLRPVLPMNLVRSDTTFSFYGVDGATVLSEIQASYRVIPRVAVLARLAIAGDSPPTPPGGFGLANPLIGAQVGFWPAKSLKVGLFLGFTIPVGLGGGVDPDPGSVDVDQAGMYARSGFEDPLFMPDYFGVWPGIDVAYITHGFTAQGEISMSLLSRARGPQTEKSSNVDLSLGLHVGYFIFPWGSVGLDFRHQRWLTSPSFVRDELNNRDITTLEPGVRFRLKLGDDILWRPGLAIGFGVDDPLASSQYKSVRVDLPFSF